jgi:hypothetical protein
MLVTVLESEQAEKAVAAAAGVLTLMSSRPRLAPGLVKTLVAGWLEEMDKGRRLGLFAVNG